VAAAATLVVENLESRLLHAVTAALVDGQLRVAGDGAADTITLDHTGTTTTVAGKAFADASITAGILVKGGAGDDTFNLRATVRPVRFEGEGDRNTVIVGKFDSTRLVAADLTIANNFVTDLILNDQADTTPRTITLDADPALTGIGTITGLTAAKVIYRANDIGGLTINLGDAGNTIDVRNTHTINTKTMTLNTGAGDDTVTLRRTFSPIDIEGQGGTDVVTVGDNGTVQGVTGDVRVSNTLGKTRLTVDNSADLVARTAIVDVRLGDGPGVVRQLAPAQVKYDPAALASLTVNGGAGGTTFDVYSTDPGYTTTLNGGADFAPDVFRVSPFFEQTQFIAGPVDIHGGGGNNALEVFDGVNGFASRDATLDVVNGVGSITGMSPAPVTYDAPNVNTVTIHGGGFGNTFTVNATAPNANTTIDTGVGADTVFVKRSAGRLTINGQLGRDGVTVGAAGNVRDVTGDLTITNVGSFSNVLIDDSEDTTFRSVSLGIAADGFGTITGLAGGNVRYRAGDLAAVTLIGPRAGARFTVDGTASNSTNPVTTLIGSAAGDTFDVRKTAGRLTINAGAGADTINIGGAANTLDPIQGPITLSGGPADGAIDTLNINDQGSTTPHVYTQTTNSLTRDGAARITFFDIDTLRINKGALSGNAPLAKNLTLSPSVKPHAPATLSGQLTDADAGDMLTLTVDWGDHTTTTTQPGRDPFSLPHAYDKPGVYTVRVIWSDNTGRSNFQERQITVGAPPKKRLR
jgi:hypothetical protein